MPETLMPVDIAAGLLLLISGILGAVKGAVRLVVGFVVAGLAVGLAGTYGESLQVATWPGFSGLGNAPEAGSMVGSALVFVGVLLAGMIADRILRKALEESSLGGMDRLVGFALGAARGAIIVGVAMLGIRAIPAAFVAETTDGSITLQATQQGIELLSPHLPDEGAAWLQQLVSDTPAD